MLDPMPQPEALLQHADFLRSLARSLLRDEAAADDLVQETFRTAIEHPPARDTNLRGWLGTVARNLARMGWRGEARRRVREQAVARPGAVPSLAEVAERLEVQRDVAQAVRALDEPYRTVVFLRHFEGLAPREIAQRLDLPVSTVHTRLQRAHARLREQLDRRHGRRAWSLALAGLAFPKVSAAAAVSVGVALVSNRIKIGLLILFLFGAGGVTWRATRAPARPAARAARETELEARRVDPEEAQPKAVPEVHLPSPPRDASAHVELVVLDGATGSPVADARVVVARAGKQGEEEINAALVKLLEEKDMGTLGATLDMELLSALEFAHRDGFSVPESRTDGGGRVRIDGLPAGVLDVIVAHGDHVPLRCSLPADGELHEVRLSGGGSLLVIAPGAAHGHGCIVSSGKMIPEGVAQLDESARCEIAHLAPGRYRVSIFPESASFTPLAEEEEAVDEAVEENTAPAGLADGIRLIADMTIREGETTTLDLTTRTLARVEGRVLDNARVGGRFIWLLDASGAQVATAATDDEGLFQFGSLEPGRYRITVSPVEWGALIHHDFEVPHNVAHVTLRIEPPRGALHGVVRHPTGTPLPNVQVFVEPGDLPEYFGGATGEQAVLEGMAGRARTDKQGRYRIQGLRAGPYRLLIGGKEGFVEQRVRLATDESRALDVTFDLASQPSLVVECYDESGTRVFTPVILRGPSGGIAENYVLGFGMRNTPVRIPVGRYTLSLAMRRFAPISGHEFELKKDRLLRITLRSGTAVTIHARAGSTVELVDQRGWAYPIANDVRELLNSPRARKVGTYGKILFPRVLHGMYWIRIDGKRARTVDVGDEPVEHDFREE